MSPATPLLPVIPPISTAAVAAATERAATLARPPGSLGALEALGVRLAGMRDGWDRPIGPGAIVVMAADHGVATRGVSAFPQSVTALMVATFARQRASIDAIAAAVGASVTIVDLGTLRAVPLPGVLDRRVGAGSGDIASEPAMTVEQAEACLAVGIGLAEQRAEQGAGVVVGGEMGIGNTTPASAIIAAVTGAEAAEVVGRGTGIDDEAWRAKVAVVERARDRAQVDGGVSLLAELGGFEIAGLAGLYLGAAARRLPVVLDGHIATAAALAAATLDPAVRDYLVAGHRSVEPGHARALAHLDLEPLLDLELRLGEGTGAALAIPLVRSAVAVLRDVATLDEVLALDPWAGGTP